MLLSVSIITPLGFASKLYQGLGEKWINNFSGDILYELFWIWAIALIFPQISIRAISVGVLLITCALEFLQLWHPPLLQAIRATFIGRTLIGTTFAEWDFPHYFLGCFGGWAWLHYLQKIYRKPH